MIHYPTRTPYAIDFSRRPTTKFLAALLSVVALLAIGSPVQAQTDAATPILNGGDDAQTATAGFYSLHWELPESETPPQSEAPEEPQFLVQEARSASFSDPDQIYKGPDLATFLSGRPNGEYFYRVGRLGPDGRTGSWSSVNHVTVRHHSLGKAFSFLAVGAIVFLATIYVIVRGDRDTRTEGEEE